MIFKKTKIQNKAESTAPLSVQTRPADFNSLYSVFGCSPLSPASNYLYKSMRYSIPIIDAAFDKTKRLLGGFKFECKNKTAEAALNEFSETVKVGPTNIGLEHFVSLYLDSLLMYGNAAGEIVLDENGQVFGLYNANVDDILILPSDNPMSATICAKDKAGRPVIPTHPELIMFTALNPAPGKLVGRSVLEGLPLVSAVLLKIYNAIGQNFDRIGNIRFAVTYKPGDNSVDKAYAKERAALIAKEWSEGMTASRCGDIRDFVAVGDIDIKVIGADNQMIDCNVPARQMIEQIIAKLAIPPFMLGLSWSTTERMSQQQADALSKEISFYRRLLDPVILKIAKAYVRTQGFSDAPQIKWDVLNFTDEIQSAQARLYNAQAQKIEAENKTAVSFDADASNA